MAVIKFGWRMEKEGLSGAAAELHKENILSQIIFHLQANNSNFAAGVAQLIEHWVKVVEMKINIWIVNDSNTNDWEQLKQKN